MKQQILFDHALCKILIEGSETKLFIKMMDGRWATQRPYENDLRGHIGALTLALDVLAGKIILGTTTTLDERDFSEKNQGAIEAPKVSEPETVETKVIDAPKSQPKQRRIL